MKGRRGGFSLIELTIALGIVGFALVAILGLVPVGMKAFQDAMRLNVEAEIVQTISRELENTPWKSTGMVGFPVGATPPGLSAYLNDFPIYFDDEGREIGAGSSPPIPSAADPRRPMFGVVVLLSPANVQGGPIQAGNSVNLLYRARIFIAYRKLDNIESRVGSGTIAANDKQWIKEYPVILAYKGF